MVGDLRPPPETDYSQLRELAVDIVQDDVQTKIGNRLLNDPQQTLLLVLVEDGENVDTG